MNDDQNGRARDADRAPERRAVEAMREALEPFVEHWQPWMDDRVCHLDDDEMSCFARVTYGDLRRARAALAASRPTDAGWDHRPQCSDPKFGPEPSIRQMVRFYYGQHGQIDADGDTEAYLAALAQSGGTHDQ